MKRLVVFFSILLSLSLTTTVFAAAYTATYVITETNGTTYTMLGIIEDSPTTWLAANGYIEADALDTRIETLAGLEKPHLVTDDKILTAVPIPADSQTNLNFTTGNSDLTSMDIITGYGGYVTVLDDPALELGNNGELIFTDLALYETGNVINKQSAIRGYYNATTDTLTVDVYDAAANETLAPDGAGSETNIPTLVGAATHWQANLTNDGNTSYVESDMSVNYFRDLYSTTNTGVGAGHINSVAISIVAAGNGTGYAKTAVKTNGTTYDGVENSLNAGLVYGTFTTTYTVNPQTGAVWTWAEVDAMEIGVSVKGTAGSLARCTQVYATVNYSAVALSVSASVTEGEYDVDVVLDTVNLELYVDTALEDSAALGGVSVPDNANDWVLMSNATPYLGAYEHSVAGTLIAHYAPADIISGTVLPDREGAAQNGAFTWGSNPAGIAVVLGSLTSVSQPSPGQTLDDPNLDILPAIEVSDWYEEPDVTGILLTNPLRPFVTIMSDATSMTEMQAWRLLGLAFVLFCTVAAAVAVRNHLLIAGIICGAAIGLMVAFTIFPLWSVVFIIGAVAAGIVAERSPSL